MTLDQVAKVLNVNKTTIQRYESGSIANIPISSIVKLAKLFSITTDELIKFDGDRGEYYPFIKMLTDLGFECQTITTEVLKDKNTDSIHLDHLIVSSPTGNHYRLSTDSLELLRSSIRNCIEFELFKLKKE